MRVKSCHTVHKVALPRKCTGVLARRLFKEWRPRKRRVLLNWDPSGRFQRLISSSSLVPASEWSTWCRCGRERREQSGLSQFTLPMESKKSNTSEGGHECVSRRDPRVTFGMGNLIFAEKMLGPRLAQPERHTLPGKHPGLW